MVKLKGDKNVSLGFLFALTPDGEGHPGAADPPVGAGEGE